VDTDSYKGLFISAPSTALSATRYTAAEGGVGGGAAWLISTEIGVYSKMVRTSTVTTPKERNVSHSLSPDTQDKTLSSTCRMVKASAPTTAGRSLPHMETLPVCMDCGLSLCCCDGCSVEACEDQACEDQACSECDSSTECTEVCSSILPCCSGCVTPEICRRASKAVTKSQEFQDLNTFAFQMPDLSLNTSTDVLIGRRNASPVNFANMSDDSLFCHFGNECDLRFTSPVDMLQHIKSEHMPKMTSTCSPHFSMYPPIPQQDHHSNYPNVHPSMLHCEWDSCKASANTAHELFNHVESQHLQAAYQIPESHKCEWLIPGLSGQTRPCGVCLPSTEELTQHITQVHVGYKKNKYKCLWQGCERGERDFGQRQKVLRHMQTHTTHKPFQVKNNSFVFNLTKVQYL